MQFKYIGNPYALDNRGEITAFGVRFPLNIPVDVESPHAIKKLMGNHHFAAVEGGQTFYQAPQLIVPGAPAQPTVSSSASEQKTAKADLVARAESLGIEVDRRWNMQKIQDAIDAQGGGDS